MIIHSGMQPSGRSLAASIFHGSGVHDLAEQLHQCRIDEDGCLMRLHGCCDWCDFVGYRVGAGRLGTASGSVINLPGLLNLSTGNVTRRLI